MDPQLLNHLLQLAAKTGDRLIVVDPASRQPFVLMGLPQYESLVGGAPAAPFAASAVTEPVPFIPVPDPIVAKANAELAAWRASQPLVPPVTEFPAPTVAGFAPEPLQPADEDRFYVEPLE